MIVTINTDASHSQDYKCGAFAFWMVCNAGKYQKAGKLKGEIVTSGHAEMSCIANALYTLKHSKWPDVKKVIINTDSMECIQAIAGSARIKNESHRAVSEEAKLLIYEITVKYGFALRDAKKFVEFRHVKGHSGKKDGRSACNRWCDEQAGIYLKQIIKSKKNGH